MGILNRRRKPQPDAASDDPAVEPKKEKGGWKRPANTAFKQQRLKAWQPILTPKTVLPTLFIIGILFAPIGALLIWGSSKVTEITIDYTACENQQPSSSPSNLSLVTVPKYSYRLRAHDDHAAYSAPQFAYIPSTLGPNDLAARNQCFVQFDIPYDLAPNVLFYYKLTNFFQNHRRYVKSLNTDQLQGKYVSPDSLNSGDCKPLAKDSSGRAIYPCGLIANSLFNDTYSNLTVVDSSGSGYDFSYNGIAWPGEAKKYSNSPKYDVSQIVPPPNWAVRYPNGYNSSAIPQLASDEHFQNWMRTAGLPTFTKLYGRNDGETLAKGRYQMVIDLNFPVQSYKGTKSIVISTVSWIGGKNPFLGWAYVGSAILFVLLAIVGLIRHLVKPRVLGDMSLLSWNR